MRSVTFLLGLVATLCLTAQPAHADSHEKTAAAAKPLKVLLVTGGGFHDYAKQKDIIATGLTERANIDVTIAYTQGGGTNLDFDGYKGDDWFNGYDVIIHNVCSAKTKADTFLPRVIKAHKEHGVGSVVIHCTMHTCRDIDDPNPWRQMLGVKSRNHEKHHPIDVTNTQPDHPIMKPFPKAWTTPQGELYRILEVFDGTTVLATGVASEKKSHACIWVHQFGKARVFGTTIGHHNETMETEEYLGLVTRGTLWAAGKLSDDGTPAAGYDKAAAEARTDDASRLRIVRLGKPAPITDFLRVPLTRDTGCCGGK